MKHIESVVLKDKKFELYKINQFETYILKKLHSKIIKDVPLEFDSPYNYTKFKKDIRFKEEYLFLLYFKKTPVAYCRINICNINPHPKNIAYLVKHHQVRKEELNKICNVDGAGVISKYRGLGIQDYFFKFREKFAKQKGYKYLFTACHPKNKFSMKNIKKNNYKKVYIYKNHKGVDRVLFKKEIAN